MTAARRGSPPFAAPVRGTGRPGRTPGRHMTHDYVDLTAEGPVGDRVFCLVDRSHARVLRTAENPALLRSSARWEAGVLSVDLQGHIVEGCLLYTSPSPRD